MGVLVKPCVCEADKLSQVKREEKILIENSALIRVTAYVKRCIPKRRKQELGILPNERSLSPQELQAFELFWIKEAQKCLADRVAKGEFKSLTPFRDGNDVLRVGGRVSNADLSYDTKHPALLPSSIWKLSSWQISQKSVWHHLTHRFTTLPVIILVPSLLKLVETRQQNIMAYCSPA